MRQFTVLGVVLGIVMIMGVLTMFAFGTILSNGNEYDFSQQFSGTGTADGSECTVTASYEYKDESSVEHVYYFEAVFETSSGSFTVSTGLVFDGDTDLPYVGCQKLSDHVYYIDNDGCRFTFTIGDKCHITSVTMVSLEESAHSFNVTLSA